MALIYVTGSNIISFNKVGKALVAFNLVGLKRGVFDYHNNIFIARELSWILAQQLQGQVRDRALPARPEQVRARWSALWLLLLRMWPDFCRAFVAYTPLYASHITIRYTKPR